MNKNVKEKIKKLKHEVLNGDGYEPVDGDENPNSFEVPHAVDEWKYYFYGSGDPADEDECFIRNLSQYTFRNLGLIVEILSDICDSLSGEKGSQGVPVDREVYQIGQELMKNPVLMDLYKAAKTLSDDDLEKVMKIMSLFSGRECEREWKN